MVGVWTPPVDAALAEAVRACKKLRAGRTGPGVPLRLRAAGAGLAGSEPPDLTLFALVGLPGDDQPVEAFACFPQATGMCQRRQRSTSVRMPMDGELRDGTGGRGTPFGTATPRLGRAKRGTSAFESGFRSGLSQSVSMRRPAGTHPDGRRPWPSPRSPAAPRHPLPAPPPPSRSTYLPAQSLLKSTDEDSPAPAAAVRAHPLRSPWR